MKAAGSSIVVIKWNLQQPKSPVYEYNLLRAVLQQVFCSKKDPNCTACPLRGSCEYALSNGRRRQAEATTGALPLPCLQDTMTQWPLTPVTYDEIL